MLNQVLHKTTVMNVIRVLPAYNDVGLNS